MGEKTEVGAPLLRLLPSATPEIVGELFRPGETIHGALHAFSDLLKRAFHAAHSAVALEVGAAPHLYWSKGRQEAGSRIERRLEAVFRECHGLLHPDLAMVYACANPPQAEPSCTFFDGTTLEPRSGDAAPIARLARMLGASSFMSSPLRSRGQAVGRLYVFSAGRGYVDNDLRMLIQLARQAGPCAESMLLVERLSPAVRSQERRRISRDLHDGTIQLYIGLKLGLEALRRKLKTKDGTAREVDELIAMAVDGIVQLRRYVGRLNGQPVRRGPLLPVLRQQAEKFTAYCGIRTQARASPVIELSASMLHEVTHIVREALSNVRRHTRAQTALVRADHSPGRLVIEVVNDDTAPADARPLFCPRSITERAQDLGGAARVELREGCTAVVVELPV